MYANAYSRYRLGKTWPWLMLTSLVLSACSAESPSTASESAPRGDVTVNTASVRLPAGLALTEPDAVQAGFMAPIPALMRLLTERDFDPEKGCWPMRTEIDGIHRDLCFRPGIPEMRPLQGRPHYFLHAGALPVPGASHRGAFAAILVAAEAAGQPRVVARLRGMAIGESGDCQCADARLRRMGRERWAWVFDATEGGRRNFHILSASSMGISEVARITTPADGVDGLRHGIEFDPSDESAEIWPLLHIVLRGNQPHDVQRHRFDETTGRYATAPQH